MQSASFVLLQVLLYFVLLQIILIMGCNGRPNLWVALASHVSGITDHPATCDSLATTLLRFLSGFGEG